MILTLSVILYTILCVLVLAVQYESYRNPDKELNYHWAEVVFALLAFTIGPLLLFIYGGGPVAAFVIVWLVFEHRL